MFGEIFKLIRQHTLFVGDRRKEPDGFVLRLIFRGNRTHTYIHTDRNFVEGVFVHDFA